jgi:hypothetical protein
MGLLAGIFLAVVGRLVVPFLFVARRREEGTDQGHGDAVHARGDLHGLDSRLPASGRRHARGAGPDALSGAPRELQQITPLAGVITSMKGKTHAAL